MHTVLEILRHLSRVARKSPEAVAIDVGAHVGAFARELLDSGLYRRVIAFEPNPVNLAELEALASLRPALTLVKKGVGACEGIADFHHDDNTATGSLMPYGAGYESKGTARKLRVPVVTLDAHLVQAPAGAPVGLVKIDTQGHDLAGDPWRRPHAVGRSSLRDRRSDLPAPLRGPVDP
jgi:FkbM family methyltransferase